MRDETVTSGGLTVGELACLRWIALRLSELVVCPNTAMIRALLEGQQAQIRATGRLREMALAHGQ